MGRTAFLCLSLLLLATSTLLLSLNGCGGSNSTSTTIPPGTIQHVVIIFQENRTPDNLFHDTVLMAKGADIASNGINSLSQTVPLSAGSLGIDYDLNHAHSAFVSMYDGGKMDGADLISYSCSQGATNCPPPNPQFWYVNPCGSSTLFPTRRAIHVWRPDVSNEPGTEFPRAPVHHFRHVRAHRNQ